MEKVRITKGDELFLLGDYINKGPDSKGVIDFIFELKSSGYNVKCLRGNHDQYLLDALNSPDEEVEFLTRGGVETLLSFDVQNAKDIPEEYLAFFASLQHFINLDRYLLVHAGLDFALEDPYNDSYSMMNIRDMEVDPALTGGRIIIHGHVPVALYDLEQVYKETYWHYSIDGGCVYDHLPDMYHLIALDLTNWKLLVQDNID